MTEGILGVRGSGNAARKYEAGNTNRPPFQFEQRQVVTAAVVLAERSFREAKFTNCVREPQLTLRSSR